jgi:hypothetical protein
MTRPATTPPAGKQSLTVADARLFNPGTEVSLVLQVICGETAHTTRMLLQSDDPRRAGAVARSLVELEALIGLAAGKPVAELRREGVRLDLDDPDALLDLVGLDFTAEVIVREGGVFFLRGVTA